MKKKSLKNRVVFFIAVAVLVVTTKEVVVASEVINDVGITFTQEDKGPIPPVNPINPDNPGLGSGKPDGNKEGNLPQTGSKVHNTLLIVGLVVSIASIEWIYKKRIVKI